MRHTGSLGRLVMAALLAVVFTPVAARVIGLTGFYGALVRCAAQRRMIGEREQNRFALS